MIKNNHFEAMDIKEKLNDIFLSSKTSHDSGDACDDIEIYKQIAKGYSKMENAISVLSDMYSNVSYVYYGNFSTILDIDCICGSEEKINSIWEENILKSIHPDDLFNKNNYELYFFHFLTSHSENIFFRYYLVNELRMKGKSGEYINVSHRLFYIFKNNRVWLALCLYTPMVCSLGKRNIVVDSVTGEQILLKKEHSNEILSAREIQVLKLIDKGVMSKNIADKLFISINTVNRHRQEILKKLKVKNSIEACRIAKYLRII